MWASSSLERDGRLTTAHTKIAAVLVSRTRHICRRSTLPNCSDSRVGLAAACFSEKQNSRAGAPGLKASMIDSPAADWTSGISKQLRALIRGGADDAQLDRLILARKSGDDELVTSLLNEVATLRFSARLTCSGLPASDLERLQSQTLSLVVNDLTSAELYAFVSWLQPLSELLHDKYRCEAFWSDRLALAVMARALCDDVLARIDSTTDRPHEEDRLPTERR